MAVGVVPRLLYANTTGRSDDGEVGVALSVDADGTVSVVENSWLQAVQRFKPAAVLKRRFQR